MRSSRQGDGAGTPGKRINGNSYSQSRTSSARLMLAGKQATTTVYEKETVRDIIPTPAHYEWGTPFLLSLQRCVSLFVSGKSS
jgi:hypothetical protein